MAGHSEIETTLLETEPRTETERQLLAILAMLLGTDGATKRWTESRTLIASGLAILVGVAMAVGIVPAEALVQSSADQTAELVGAIVTILGGIFAVLRLDTDRGIG